ncbi:hypothetical protein EPO34_01575 [Patescibacteria group bacterium]|nr:MAG: hypothetical protein EPO34_01575 [Patescibacteria group bacterium]
MPRLRLFLTRIAGSFADLVRSSSVYRRTMIASVLLVAATLALPAWKIVPMRVSEPFIPLHYNVYIGIDRFGPWYYAFIPGVLGATLLVVNTVFQAVFYRRERMLSTFFAVATVFAEGMLCVAMVLTVLLNL